MSLSCTSQAAFLAPFCNTILDLLIKYIYMKRRKGCLKANTKHTGSMQEVPKSTNKKEEEVQKYIPALI